MKKIDILGISFGNFKRRKLRSILTVLGVVIGTASIVTMMSLGIGIKKSFDDSFASMGDLTTVTVYPGYSDSGQTKKLDDDAVEQLTALPKVDAVSPQIELNGKLMIGRYEWYGQIVGVDLALADRIGLEVEQGTGFTDETKSTSKSFFALFGSETPFQFSKPSSGGRRMGGGMMIVGGGGGGGSNKDTRVPEVELMAPETRIRYTFDYNYGRPNSGSQSTKRAPLYTVKPAGLLKSSGGQTDYSVYVDIETAQAIQKAQMKYNDQRVTSNKAEYNSILVYADDMESTGALVEQINDMGYQSWSSGQYIAEAQKQLGMIQMLLGAIGGVSLVVAAIGITNTMVMSIYERTREIGIMKVIGCYLQDIRTMFLVEAGFIGLFGGIVGIGISYGLSALVNMAAAGGAMGGMGMGGMGGSISIIPPWLALLAVAFAIFVALVSGFFPARRAMRLSALEAMKN